MTATDRVVQERRRRRPTRSGVVLSSDLILDAALTLIDSEGAGALSMRKLGTALGCDPTAVYRYFRGTDDLLLALSDRLIGYALEGFDPTGDDWAGDLRTFGVRAYEALLRHPRVTVVSASRVTRRPNEFRGIEIGLTLLHRAGFDDETAVRLYQAFIDTVLGHAALDAGALSLSPQEREADAAAWADTYSALPAESYPRIAAVRDHLPMMAESSFQPALDLVLAAITAQAPRKARNKA